MTCPKCGITVIDGAVDCPGCGVVLAKASDAMDRAFVRRQMQTREKPLPPAPEKSSNMLRNVIILIVIGVFAYGAWSWYTDDQQSDLDRLAAEVKQADGSKPELDGGRTTYRFWVRTAKFGVAIGVFVIGYKRLKSSLSP